MPACGSKFATTTKGVYPAPWGGTAREARGSGACPGGIIPFILICVLFAVSPIFCGCTANNNYDDLLRLHVLANSNSSIDQSVKLKVRDEVNAYIESNIKRSTFEEAYEAIGDKLDEISEIAENVLVENGFDYGARARLDNEYFPARQYGDTVIESGYYDALIIELGDGAGDNWWCVIYPPLCYGEDNSFEYKSFFAELFG